MSATLKIMSLNVRRISNFKKRRTIFTWCRRKSAYVIFLQETHSNKTTEIQWKNEWGVLLFLKLKLTTKCMYSSIFMHQTKIKNLSNSSGSCILCFKLKT